MSTPDRRVPVSWVHKKCVRFLVLVEMYLIAAAKGGVKHTQGVCEDA